MNRSSGQAAAEKFAKTRATCSGSSAGIDSCLGNWFRIMPDDDPSVDAEDNHRDEKAQREAVKKHGQQRRCDEKCYK